MSINPLLLGTNGATRLLLRSQVDCKEKPLRGQVAREENAASQLSLRGQERCKEKENF